MLNTPQLTPYKIVFQILLPIMMEHQDTKEDERGKESQRTSLSDSRDNLCSPSSWGYESPSQLNREVTSILSKGNPPKTARSQFTHPEQGSARIPLPDTTYRSNSCPLYQNTKLWGSESPHRTSDQSVELRNHLYQAALNQNSSPFTPPLRFPFLPPNRGFFPPYPPGMDITSLRQSFHPPFPFVSPLYRSSNNNNTSPAKPKRKYSEEAHSSGSVLLNTRQPPPPSRPVVTSTPSISTSSPSSPPPVIPPYFKKGSLIQLASGEMKKVEDLETEDFVESAKQCPDLSIEHATVVRIEPAQSSGLLLLCFTVGKRGAGATISTSPDHPFFVSGHGWSSCSPSLTMARYRLSSHQLTVGDTCISLTHHIDSSALMPPPHTSPETVKDCKQVRFQDSPVLKKRKIVDDLPENMSETPPPVSLKVRVSNTWESSTDDQRFAQREQHSPLSEVAVGDTNK